MIKPINKFITIRAKHIFIFLVPLFLLIVLRNNFITPAQATIDPPVTKKVLLLIYNPILENANLLGSAAWSTDVHP